MTTIVCAAHADDEVIGLGGTIAKLASEGEDVVVIIFFYGAGSVGRLSSWPPWLSREDVVKQRVKESKQAGEILGVHKTIFLGMDGGNLTNPSKEFDSAKKKTLSGLFREYKPEK
ncbi:MAG TPA: PIG-L family deacetylase, partial [Candidatus Woesearchaeota archaeon]|nr:PIG-L family deacetylase [Candidatus Woesearchaeota archaeon]